MNADRDRIGGRQGGILQYTTAKVIKVLLFHRFLFRFVFYRFIVIYVCSRNATLKGL